MAYIATKSILNIVRYLYTDIPALDTKIIDVSLYNDTFFAPLRI